MLRRSWLFHRHGRPIRDFYKRWREACKEAKVASRIVHDLRRTAVRNLERAGVPRSGAMKLTRHKTDVVYRRYAVVSPGGSERRRREARRLHVMLKVKVDGQGAQTATRSA